ELLAALREAEGELERLRESLATFAERRDYLQTAAAELGEAKLREGEEEDLKSEAARLAHADRLRELMALANERLAQGDRAGRWLRPRPRGTRWSRRPRSIPRSPTRWPSSRRRASPRRSRRARSRATSTASMPTPSGWRRSSSVASSTPGSRASTGARSPSC